MRERDLELPTGLTQEQFFDWLRHRHPPAEQHYELLNGKVVMSPPAGFPHGSVADTVGRRLGTFVEAHQLGRTFSSSQGFELPSGDTVEPDYSFVSAERWANAPVPTPGKFLRVVPDLVVEILSPDTGTRDRTEKKDIYERNGVREYWLIDSRAREVTVLRRSGDHFDSGTRYGDNARATSVVLPGFGVDVSDLLR